MSQPHRKLVYIGVLEAGVQVGLMTEYHQIECVYGSDDAVVASYCHKDHWTLERVIEQGAALAALNEVALHVERRGAPAVVMLAKALPYRK